MRLGDLDALKKAFNKWWGCDDIPTTIVEDLIDDAPTVSPQDIYQEGHYDGHLEGYTKAINEERPQAQGEWIPVSEKLPDDREDTYWICTDGEYQCQCRWTNVNAFWSGLKTDWHWCLFDIPQYHKVIAWQPLPEPYKKEGG